MNTPRERDILDDAILLGAAHAIDKANDHSGGAAWLWYLITPPTWEPLVLVWLCNPSIWYRWWTAGGLITLTVALAASYLVHHFAARRPMTMWATVVFSALLWLWIGHDFLVPAIKDGMTPAGNWIGTAIVAAIAVRWKHMHMSMTRP
jgi:hypothetical protein